MPQPRITMLERAVYGTAALVGLVVFAGGWSVKPYDDTRVLYPLSALSSALFAVVTFVSNSDVVVVTGFLLAVASAFMHATENDAARVMDHALAAIFPVVIMLPALSGSWLSGVVSALILYAALLELHWWQTVAIVVIVALFAAIIRVKVAAGWQGWRETATAAMVVLSALSAGAIKYFDYTDYAERNSDVVHSMWHLQTATAAFALIVFVEPTTQLDFLTTDLASTWSIVVCVLVGLRAEADVNAIATIVFCAVMVATQLTLLIDAFRERARQKTPAYFALVALYE